MTNIPPRPVQAPIPAKLLAWAKTRGIVDPEYQWRRFLDANGGEPPQDNLDDRFIRWLSRAPTKRAPEPEPERPREPSPPAREWHPPPDWEEARRLAAAGKVDNAANAQSILAALNKIPRHEPSQEARGRTIATPDDPEVVPTATKPGEPE